MKKINTIASVIKAISAWLHGDSGAHFRSYTYPKIKSVTRRVINLGIYEQIEKFYKIVDDTYYKGDMNDQYDDVPTEVEMVELVERAETLEQSSFMPDFSGTQLPDFSQVRNGLFIWKGIEQGNTYRCGTFTMNNMMRTQMLKQGLMPPLEVTAIDPLYIATKHGKGKTGTVMSHAFKYLAEKGFPTPSWTPMMTNHNTELEKLESYNEVKNAENFSSIRATGEVKTTNSFAEAVELDKTLPSNWEMQVSISFNASLRYFGQLVPYIQKVNGRYQLTRTGGHAVHGVRGSFSKWEDGEGGLAIIESAYRSHEDGWRFIKSRLFLYGMITVRFVEFAVDGQQTSQPPKHEVPEPADYQILSTKTIKYGDRGENVKALQRFLRSQGYVIEAGVTGNFFEQTATALSAWQFDQFGRRYTGRWWGAISRDRYVEIKG